MKIKLTEPLIICNVTYPIGMEFVLTIDEDRKMLSSSSIDLIVIGMDIKYEIIN